MINFQHTRINFFTTQIQSEGVRRKRESHRGAGKTSSAKNTLRKEGS